MQQQEKTFSHCLSRITGHSVSAVSLPSKGLLWSQPLVQSAWRGEDGSQSLAAFSYPCGLGVHVWGWWPTATPVPTPPPHTYLQISGASASFVQILPLVSLCYNPSSLYFEYASLIIQLKAYFVTLRVFDIDHGDNGMNSKHHVDWSPTLMKFHFSPP